MLHSRIALLSLLGGIAMAVCQWLVFVYAPEEQVMGLPHKIFYTHLPLARRGLDLRPLGRVARPALRAGKPRRHQHQKARRERAGQAALAACLLDAY